VKRAIFGLALLFCFSGIHAESRYVTDQFKITMRSGESATHKILRMLPSGYEVDVISSDRQTGYSQVRTGDGSTGYVLTRQLMPIPSARDRLASTEKRLAELQEEPGKLSAKLSTLEEKHQKLSEEHGALQKVKLELEQELSGIRRTASNAINISNERNALRKQVATLTRQVEDLKQENRELGNNSAQQWFLIGAGVIVGGIILGLILPHLRVQRRKSSWGSL
jgi:SH3 domain protein